MLPLLCDWSLKKENVSLLYDLSLQKEKKLILLCSLALAPNRIVPTYRPQTEMGNI